MKKGFKTTGNATAFPELHKIIGEYENLEELNYLAVKPEELQVVKQNLDSFLSVEKKKEKENEQII